MRHVIVRTRRGWTSVVAASTVAVLVAGLGAAAAGNAAPASPRPPLRAGADAAVDPNFALRTRVVTAAPAEPGDHLAVTVGDEKYAAPTAGQWICPTGVWVLRLERNSLEKAGSDSYPMCTSADVTRLADVLKQASSEQTVIVNSLDHAPGGDSRTLPELGKALAEIGAPADDFAAIDLARTGFSVYGIPGLPAGEAYTATDNLTDEAHVAAGSPTEASINGTLARDNYGNFALTMPDYALYDIGQDGAITLDGHTYPVPARPAGFTGGFHVLVVDRRTLATISDTLYSTNDARGEQYRMGADLTRLAATRGQSVLIFLASVGNPGGSALLPGPARYPAPCAGSTAFTVTCVYKPTAPADQGSEQQFTVPAFDGVSNLHVTLQGGYGGYAKSGGEGGDPDRVTGDLPVGADQAVHPGQTLYVEVAGEGTSGGNRSGGLGGWNGGAGGGDSECCVTGWPGGGGGGASDIRTVSRAGGNTPASLASRLAVAGGGGGAGGDSYDAGRGGDGGQAGGTGGDGLPGSKSYGEAGGGGGAGTSSQGGAGGAGLHDGTPGTLGLGGAGKSTQYSYGASGGGGGGYYGGGAGGVGGRTAIGGGAGGGGGGSDLVPAGGTVQPVIHHEPASVTISYSVPFGTVAQALRPFGATPSVIEDLGTSPRYALVGALNTPAAAAAGLSPDSPEASPLIRAHATGELQGVLERGRQDMWYGSITSNVAVVQTDNGKQHTIVTNYGLYNVISHIDAPWPVPAPGPDHDAQQNALTYLSQQVCDCDNIRDEYNADSATLDDWQRALSSVIYPTRQHEFDATNFRKVQNQLDTELEDVKVVDGLKDGMHMLLSDQEQMLRPALEHAYEEVRKSIEVDNGAKVSPVTSFILEIFTIGAEVAGLHALVPVLGVINAVLRLTTELANEKSGEDMEALATTAAKLGTDTAANFAAALSSLSHTFDYLYGNWGKLSAVAEGLTKHETAWDVSAGDAGQYVTAASDAIQLGYYRALVPVVYQRFEAQAAPTADLHAWCIGGTGEGKEIHKCLGYASDINVEYPSSAYTSPVQAPALNFKAAHDNVLVLMPPSAFSGTHPFPSELMDELEKSGLYTPYLFLRWPMTGLTCPGDLSNKYNDYHCVDAPGLGSPAGHRPLKITTTGLPTATVGRPYHAALAATGGDGGAHIWTLRKHSRLPSGITLSTHGVLSGTPTRPGHYRFTVAVDDPVTATLTLTVRPAPPAAEPSPPPHHRLADTGSPILPLVVLAVVLLFAGVVLTALRRAGKRAP